jgi:hypothetical protein
MRRRWYILAALAGVVAAGVVWAWPVGPRWRSGPEAGRLEGFSPDGRTLVTSRVPPGNGLTYPNPEVSRWDAATGVLLGRADMSCAVPFTLKAVSPSADGRLALVGEGPTLDLTSQNFASGEWYLHDAVTGERLAGPIAGVAMASYGAFSRDGRWFTGTRGDPRGGFKGLGGNDIFSAETGGLVVALPDRDGLRAWPSFAPDGETAAVHWGPKDPKDAGARHSVQIIELPSGRERRRFDLPPRNWVRVRNWDGRRLQVVASDPDVPSYGFPRRCYVFDLSQDPAGEGVEEPGLSEDANGEIPIYWAEDTGRAAYFRMVPPVPTGTPSPLEDLLTRLLGPAHTPSRPMQVSVRFVDTATGATRYQLPRPIGHPVIVSPDGRLLACAGDEQSVEVWDTDPPTRWPGALAAGATAAGGVLALGWWRRRRPATAKRPAMEAQGQGGVR